MATPCTTCRCRPVHCRPPLRRRFLGRATSTPSPRCNLNCSSISPTELWNRWWHQGKRATAVQRRLFGKKPVRKKLIRGGSGGGPQPGQGCVSTPSTEAELDVLMDVFGLAQTEGLDYTASLAMMLKAVLISPQFLFITPSTEISAEQEIVPLDDHQLASRLSYLLWASPPDAKLSTLADQGKLHHPKMLRTQIKRLLKHPRARALFDGFGAQWLRVTDLRRQVFDPELFPQMTAEMREAMADEPRLLFENIVQKNHRVIRFIDSDYTYVNEPLASLYGIKKPIRGPRMRRIQLDNPNRGGILGMSATLAATSFPNRTSPVRRGLGARTGAWGTHPTPHRISQSSRMRNTRM